MLATELIRRTIVLLAAGMEDSPWYGKEAEIGACISLAMHQLAEEVASDPARAGMLQQGYVLTLSDGISDNIMSANGGYTSLPDVLWDSLPNARVLDANNTRLYYVPDLFTFSGPQIAGLKYYTLSQPSIIVRSHESQYATGGGIQGPITVIANYIPFVSNSQSTLPALPVGLSTPANGGPLDDDAVRTLAKVVLATLPAPSRAPKVPVPATT